MGIHNDSNHFFVFSTLYGTHRMKQCPQGHKNSSSYFQMLMDQIFGDLSSYVVNYLDDVLCFSKTYEENLRHLEESFRRLHNNLVINIKKSEFLKTETEFLGFKLSLNDIS